MTFRTLSGIIFIAVGTLALSRESVAGQSAPTTVDRIAYESCYFDSWDTYQYVCSVVVRADGIDTIVAPVGYTPKWSPDGGRIAFVGDLWEADIKVVHLADLTVTNLTSDPAFDGAPAWSPDGSTIAFVSTRTGIPELYRVNDDGTGLVRLTTAIGFNGRFAWSPDGRTIALARDVAGEPNLYRINADGTGIVRLTAGVGGVGEFDWSSDGTRIVFDCATEVCVINADATGVSRLTASSGRSAVFAPGDGRMAFVTTGFGPAAEIAVRHEDGTIVRVAPGTPGTNPAWSWDGTSLLFEGAEPIAYEGCCWGACNADTYCTPIFGLYTVDAVGANVRLLMSGSTPDWLRPRPGQPLASFTHHCAGSSCDFDAAGSSDPNGAIASYGWRWGDGTTSTGAAVSHAYTTGGTFIVTLTVTDNDGVTSAVSRRIVANAPPTPSFVASCAAGMCTYDASGSADPDGTIASYEWTFGDGATLYQPAGAATATHAYRTGTFTVQLVVKDNGGAGATASTTVQAVNNPPVPAFTRVCDAVRCTFDASTSADPEGRALQYYWWDFGDSYGVTGAAIQEHIYAAPGTYRIVLTVADDVGLQAAIDATITIQPRSMHVGDLDGVSTAGSRASTIFNVTVAVHDGDHRPVTNARVTGLWSSGEAGWCTTNGTGQCTVSTALRATQAGTTFTIRTVKHMAYVYQGLNHDPDRDSDGTTITITKK
jgi:PKD repeat protein